MKDNTPQTSPPYSRRALDDAFIRIGINEGYLPYDDADLEESDSATEEALRLIQQSQQATARCENGESPKGEYIEVQITDYSCHVLLKNNLHQTSRSDLCLTQWRQWSLVGIDAYNYIDQHSTAIEHATWEAYQRGIPVVTKDTRATSEV